MKLIKNLLLLNQNKLFIRLLNYQFNDKNVIVTDNTVENNEQLFDNFGRQHTYLRISLTERCNLRC